MIKIGNTGIVGVYKGSTPITSIYKGINLVYTSGISYGKDDYVIKVLTTAASQYVSLPLSTDQWLICDWGDGSTVEEKFNNSVNTFKHSYANPGTYYIILKYKYAPPTSQLYAFKPYTSDASKIIDIVHMPETPIIQSSILRNDNTENYNVNLASLAFTPNIKHWDITSYAGDNSVNKEFTLLLAISEEISVNLRGIYSTLHASNFSPTSANINIYSSNISEFTGFFDFSKCDSHNVISGTLLLTKIEKIALPTYTTEANYGNCVYLGNINTSSNWNNNLSYMYISNIGQYPCHYIFFNNPNWGDNTKGYSDAYDSLIRSLNDATEDTTGTSYLHLGNTIYDRVPKDVKLSLRDKGYKLVDDVLWIPNTYLTYDHGSKYSISGKKHLSGEFTIKFNMPGTYTFKASMSGTIWNLNKHYLRMYDLDSTTNVKVNIDEPKKNTTQDNIQYVVPDDGQEHTAKVEWSQGEKAVSVTIEVSVYDY